MNFNINHLILVSTLLLFGCTSQKYCSVENYAAQKERFNYTKCSASVAADVVLVTVAVIGVVAVAQSGTSSPNQKNNYDGNCPCPADLDENGNRCGLRSAYSRAGGAAPNCTGKL